MATHTKQRHVVCLSCQFTTLRRCIWTQCAVLYSVRTDPANDADL